MELRSGIVAASRTPYVGERPHSGISPMPSRPAHFSGHIPGSNTRSNVSAQSSASFNLSDAGISSSNNSRYALSNPLPSPPASNYDELEEPEHKHQRSESVPSPPTSEHDELEKSKYKHQRSESSDGCPFPFNSMPLTPSKSNNSDMPETPRTPHLNRRVASNNLGYLTPPASPDRYISNRFSPQEPSKTFRFSKTASQLSSIERLWRKDSASPDPFGPLHLPRLRNLDADAVASPRNGDAQRGRSHSRLTGAASMLTLPQDPLALQTRRASRGAVWNVGGHAEMSHAGPIRSISNGRGGFISSGSNAPMFASRFFDDDTFGQEAELMEARLAAALELDPAQRVLDHSRFHEQGRSASAGRIGIKPRPFYDTPRTRWKNGEWTLEGSRTLLDAPSLRDDYYCTVLAYCHTAQTIAVGLGNRVYLWSEAFGVRYPPEPPSQGSTYVTSVSFSSTEGGHSILAIGRSSGQISLWSINDPDTIRFQSQQPCAIACVGFKPVTTRRPSERFGCLMSTEELLVGDEVGNVYYYSVEWMSKQQIDIHGWTGAMTLLAKITVHNQQICGLAWSPNGEYFATGANDNLCCLFEVKEILNSPRDQDELDANHRSPFQTLLGGFGLPNFIARTRTQSEVMGMLPNGMQFQQTRVVPGNGGCMLIGEGRQKHKWVHSAAIKAIAFCPWQHGLIATGGGSNDRAIHFYHTISGASLATINVHAQVTSLIWSTTRREIAATFGYAQPDHPYRIAVFSWPDCKQVVAIPWANDMRALYAIPYPGGPGETTSLGGTWWSRTRDEGSIVVASSDESVKFHEVWSGTSKNSALQGGLLGGSDILEGLEGIEKDDHIIR